MQMAGSLFYDYTFRFELRYNKAEIVLDDAMNVSGYVLNG